MNHLTQKFCKPIIFGIKSVSCLYPPILELKYKPGDLPIKIVNMVCFHLAVNMIDILGPSRKPKFSDIRSIAITLIYKYSNISKTATGIIFKRDHSTIIASMKKCDELIKTDKKFRENFNLVKERIENYLLLNS